MKINIKNNLQKIINSILILIFFIQPVFIFANQVPSVATALNEATANQTGVLRSDFIDGQINEAILGTDQRSRTTTIQAPAGSPAVGVASCFGSQILSELIVKNVSSFASGVAGTVSDVIFNVPVAESGQTGGAIKTEAAASVGTGFSLFGLTIPTLPAWDAMAYCIVNTMIIYIADSTIAWVNSGFEGNPAFVNNPEQFFQDLANQEKINFLQGLAYGINSNVCKSFSTPLLKTLLSRYGRNRIGNQFGYQTGGFNNRQITANSCAFDNTPGQLNAFFNTSFSAGGGWNTWFQITQNPMNNPFSIYYDNISRLEQQVEAVKISNERELTWNNGYLSFRKCENGEKDKSKCNITTPGSVVQSQLEKTLNIGKDRLVLADKFNQVVTVVVDQLITTALDKTFDTINRGVNEVNESLSGNSNRNTNPWLNTNIKPFYDLVSTSTNSTSTTSTTTSR